jgi:DNA-binding transcriptional LysR family regulator
LTAIAWRSEALIIACHPSHALAGRKSAPISALRGEPFIALEQGLKIREEIDHALAFHNVEVNVALEFDNIETIKRAIEAGVGVSLLPAPTVEREAAGGSLKVVPLAGLNLVRPLGVIHRRDEELSSASKMFVDLLQSHAWDEEFASVNGKSTNGLAKPILNSVNS